MRLQESSSSDSLRVIVLSLLIMSRRDESAFNAIMYLLATQRRGYERRQRIHKRERHRQNMELAYRDLEDDSKVQVVVIAFLAEVAM